jgi:trehalose-6-phosphate synthase
MRLSARFTLPLIITLALIAYFTVPLVDSFTLKWFVRDIDMRSRLISNTLNDSLEDAIAKKNYSRISTLFDRAMEDERLYALGFCSPTNVMVVKTKTFPDNYDCSVMNASGTGEGRVYKIASGPIHLAFYNITTSNQLVVGKLILIHDISFISRRNEATKRSLYYLFLIIAAIISFLTVVIAELSWRGWMQTIRKVLRREGLLSKSSPDSALNPIVKDIQSLIQDLQKERGNRDSTLTQWTPKTLKKVLNEQLAGDEVLIVSNREPYIHVHRNNQIEVQVPASGLVTALEPIMRACSGTWIAHGSGSADRETVDRRDHVRVPPEDPSYEIRRVWLTEEEEKGYYYGFANEGMWPLCHIAHTRPTFRSEDWKAYVAVNQKFAKTVIEEAKTDNPVILVQDYHFALLPQMVREKLPKATIITFWHIPWPNSESFGICPWREEILKGLLGSSILGFHTRFHCNNFLETVDRFLEARIDKEMSTISFNEKLTAVHHYPISIEWPTKPSKNQKTVPECKKFIRELNGMPADRLLGIGVDRLDYTKGILERFLAVERLFELEPSWIGKFTFIQIAAPTRSTIEQYQHLETQVRALAKRINERFGSVGYEPICLKVEHHSPSQVFEYFRAAELCFVNSLHDGMNLVSKEFIAAREDEHGVLILSQFAGAAKELPEAVLVNPYNIDQCAAALHLALSMPAVEQQARMRSMRHFVEEFNIFRWAGKMLIDAARMRQKNRVFERMNSEV